MQQVQYQSVRNNKFQQSSIGFGIWFGNQVLFSILMSSFGQRKTSLMRQLMQVPMEAERIRLYGRDHITKRKTVQYGRDYVYNPLAKRARDWTPMMLKIKDKLLRPSGSVTAEGEVEPRVMFSVQDSSRFQPKRRFFTVQ